MNWKEMLHEHIAEEAHGYQEYMDLAKMAEEEGCCHEAGVLRDIAHEEQIHHRLLSEMSPKDVKY